MGRVGVGAGGLLALSYLLGTFPTALIVARLAGHDPTKEGSGNPGASNVYRLAGAQAGMAVFLGDAAKGAIATGMGRAAGGPRLALACGIAAVVGHDPGRQGSSTVGCCLTGHQPGKGDRSRGGWTHVAHLDSRPGPGYSSCDRLW